MTGALRRRSRFVYRRAHRHSLQAFGRCGRPSSWPIESVEPSIAVAVVEAQLAVDRLGAHEADIAIAQRCIDPCVVFGKRPIYRAELRSCAPATLTVTLRRDAEEAAMRHEGIWPAQPLGQSISDERRPIDAFEVAWACAESITL